MISSEEYVSSDDDDIFSLEEDQEKSDDDAVSAIGGLESEDSSLGSFHLGSSGADETETEAAEEGGRAGRKGGVLSDDDHTLTPSQSAAMVESEDEDGELDKFRAFGRSVDEIEGDDNADDDDFLEGLENEDMDLFDLDDILLQRRNTKRRRSSQSAAHMASFRLLPQGFSEAFNSTQNSAADFGETKVTKSKVVDALDTSDTADKLNVSGLSSGDAVSGDFNRTQDFVTEVLRELRDTPESEMRETMESDHVKPLVAQMLAREDDGSEALQHLQDLVDTSDVAAEVVATQHLGELLRARPTKALSSLAVSLPRKKIMSYLIDLHEQELSVGVASTEIHNWTAYFSRDIIIALVVLELRFGYGKLRATRAHYPYLGLLAAKKSLQITDVAVLAERKSHNPRPEIVTSMCAYLIFELVDTSSVDIGRLSVQDLLRVCIVSAEGGCSVFDSDTFQAIPSGLPRVQNHLSLLVQQTLRQKMAAIHVRERLESSLRDELCRRRAATVQTWLWSASSRAIRAARFEKRLAGTFRSYVARLALFARWRARKNQVFGAMMLQRICRAGWERRRCGGVHCISRFVEASIGARQRHTALVGALRQRLAMEMISRCARGLRSRLHLRNRHRVLSAGAAMLYRYLYAARARREHAQRATTLVMRTVCGLALHRVSTSVVGALRSLVLVQACARIRVALRRVRKRRRTVRKGNALVLQRFGRGLLLRKEFGTRARRYRELAAAARAWTSSYRTNLLRRIRLKKVTVGMFIGIKSMVRVYHRKRHAYFLENASVALDAIQSVGRGWLGRERIFQRKKAVTFIQSWLRTWAAQCRRHTIGSLSVVQAGIRGRLSGQVMHGTAIRVLQRFVRSKLALSQRVKRQICLIQRVSRGAQCRGGLSTVHLVRSVQAACRARLSAVLMEEQRFVSHIALVQTTLAAFQSRRMSCGRKYVIDVAAFMRFARSKRLFHCLVVHRWRSAVRSLHNVGRGWLVRKALCRQHQATILVQSCLRRFLSCRARDHRAVNLVAAMLQFRYAHSLRRARQLTTVVTRYGRARQSVGYASRLTRARWARCALLLQRCGNGYLTRDTVQFMRCSVGVMQRFMWCHVARLAAQRRAATVVDQYAMMCQSRVRCAHVVAAFMIQRPLYTLQTYRALNERLLSRAERCSQLLQRVGRGMLCREAAYCHREALFVVQRFAFGALAVREKHTMAVDAVISWRHREIHARVAEMHKFLRQSVVGVQSAMRAASSLRHVRRREVAHIVTQRSLATALRARCAVLIQSACRGASQRQPLREKHMAVVQASAMLRWQLAGKIVASRRFAWCSDVIPRFARLRLSALRTCGRARLARTIQGEEVSFGNALAMVLQRAGRGLSTRRYLCRRREMLHVIQKHMWRAHAYLQSVWHTNARRTIIATQAEIRRRCSNYYRLFLLHRRITQAASGHYRHAMTVDLCNRKRRVLVLWGAQTLVRTVQGQRCREALRRKRAAALLVQRFVHAAVGAAAMRQAVARARNRDVATIQQYGRTKLATELSYALWCSRQVTVVLRCREARLEKLHRATMSVIQPFARAVTSAALTAARVFQLAVPEGVGKTTQVTVGLKRGAALWRVHASLRAIQSSRIRRDSRASIVLSKHLRARQSHRAVVNRVADVVASMQALLRCRCSMGVVEVLKPIVAARQLKQMLATTPMISQKPPPAMPLKEFDKELRRTKNHVAAAHVDLSPQQWAPIPRARLRVVAAVLVDAEHEMRHWVESREKEDRALVWEQLWLAIGGSYEVTRSSEAVVPSGGADDDGLTLDDLVLLDDDPPLRSGTTHRNRLRLPQHYNPNDHLDRRSLLLTNAIGQPIQSAVGGTVASKRLNAALQAVDRQALKGIMVQPQSDAAHYLAKEVRPGVEERSYGTYLSAQPRVQRQVPRSRGKQQRANSRRRIFPA